MTLFPKFPKIQRPKALKIDVFDYATRYCRFSAESSDTTLISPEFHHPYFTRIFGVFPLD